MGFGGFEEVCGFLGFLGFEFLFFGKHSEQREDVCDFLVGLGLKEA